MCILIEYIWMDLQMPLPGPTNSSFATQLVGGLFNDNNLNFVHDDVSEPQSSFTPHYQNEEMEDVLDNEDLNQFHLRNFNNNYIVRMANNRLHRVRNDVKYSIFKTLRYSPGITKFNKRRRLNALLKYQHTLEGLIKRLSTYKKLCCDSCSCSHVSKFTMFKRPPKNPYVPLYRQLNHSLSTLPSNSLHLAQQINLMSAKDVHPEAGYDC